MKRRFIRLQPNILKEKQRKIQSKKKKKKKVEPKNKPSETKKGQKTVNFFPVQASLGQLFTPVKVSRSVVRLSRL